MAEFNLKMIKFFFVVAIAMLILAMTSGMNILRGAKFFSWGKMAMEWDYIKYKKALAAGEKNNSPSKPADRNAESVPVLLYHGVIADANWKADDTSISLDNFRSQMFSLKQAGYQTITLSEFNDFMKNGKKLPEKSILLTFDDGRKDSFYPVDPILRALNYNAVIFVITGQSLNPDSQSGNFYLTLAELEEMKNSGRWEIESHGDADHEWEKISAEGEQGHFLSNRLWLPSQERLESADEAEKRILNDLHSSKSKIENNFGKKVLGFAYPFNDYGQEEQNFSQIQGFIKDNIGKVFPLTFFQVADDDPVGNFPDQNELFVKRIDVNAKMAVQRFLQILAQNQEKTLPYMDAFWEDQGWVSRWGTKKIWGDLALSDAEGEKTGNLTALLGTEEWENYAFSANFKIEQGNSISQVVGYKNDDNYITCNFSASEISVTEKINGEEKIIAEKEMAFDLFQNSENQIETEIKSGQVGCFLNGIKEIEARMSGKNTIGEVGFYIWDDLPESSTIRIKKVEVLPL